MSDHVRKQIRKQIVSALHGLPYTADRVFESRGYPISQEQLPGLLVYTTTEGSEREDSPTDSMRDVSVLVIGVVKQGNEFEDQCDDIALEVERAIDELGEMSGLAKIYHGIQNTETSMDAEDIESTHGAIAMEFLYTYRTRRGAPDVAI